MEVKSRLQVLLPGCLTAAVLATAAVLPFLGVPADRGPEYRFEVAIASDSAGIAQLFFDVGRGFNEPDSVSARFNGGGVASPCLFAIPLEGLRALRFDPINGPGRVVLSQPRIVGASDKVVHAFSPEDFRPVQQVASWTTAADSVSLVTEADANDPILEIRIPPSLSRKPVHQSLVRRIGPKWATIFVGAILLSAIARRWLTSWLRRVGTTLLSRPVITLGVSAAVAIIIQCHPLIFFNRSLVSPDNASYLLYDGFPTLPGYQTTKLEDSKGSDVGAMMYHHLYFPLLQRDALFRDGELPLWNRYTMCGLPGLGQGQTMFGEALNMIPLLAGGSAWSWDLKFVLARWLYAFGLGIAVWLATRHLSSAVITSLSGAFVGFFAFKMNHALQFSVALSPWILVAWLLLREARTRRRLVLAALALCVANWEVFTSGTIKEASMLIVCLNGVGALIIFLASTDWRQRALRLAYAAGAGVVFILVTTPLWLTFLDTMQASTSSYAHRVAVQIPPRWFLGFFEDLLYRQHSAGEAHMLPSANLVVMAGVGWALVRVRELAANRTALAMVLGALIPLILAFAIVPSSWIVRIPFVANIHHINSTFSCVLLVLGSVVSGCGFHFLARRIGKPGWWIDLLLFALGVGIFLGLFLSDTPVRTFSPFFRFYLPSLGLALIGLHCAIGAWHWRRDSGVLLVGVAIALVVLLWRHGMYLHTPFDSYVLNPKARADFQLRSPGVAFVQAHMDEPSRPNGIRYNLFSGYGTMYGWESVYGVDPLRNEKYDQLARAGHLLKLYWCLDVPRSDQWLEENTRMLQRFLDLLGVRHYLASSGTSPARMEGLRHVASLDLEVYESPTVWPRAFYCDRLEAYESVESLITRINGSIDPRPFAAVFASDVPGISTAVPPTEEDPARIIHRAGGYHLTTNTTQFTVEASGPGVVVLHENFTDDFRAFLDGKRVPYFRVNHTFKGISVSEAGTHVVRFEYWPRRLTLALVMAGFGVGAGVLTFVGIWRSGRPRQLGGEVVQDSRRGNPR